MRILIIAAVCLFSSFAFSQDAKTVEKLAFGESDEKVEAIAALVATGDEKSAAILQALADGELYTSGKRVLIVKGDSATDAATGPMTSTAAAWCRNGVTSTGWRR